MDTGINKSIKCKVEREFPSTPLVGVGAVVVHDGRVLLVRRGTEPLKGHWTLPGGMLEVGEALTAGVVREVREETGLDVEPVELVELLDRIHREDEPRPLSLRHRRLPLPRHRRRAARGL